MDAGRGRSGARFLRFAAISGFGWLLDATLLLVLVLAAGLLPAVANTISSCCAALTVFLISRQTVFDKAAHRLLLRIAAYLGYTLVLILIASAAVQGIVTAATPWMTAQWPGWGSSLTLALAKVIVTPPQLVSNFFMSRLLAERFAKPPVHD